MHFEIEPGICGSTYVYFHIGSDEHAMEISPYVMGSDTLNGLLWATDWIGRQDEKYRTYGDLSSLGAERFLMTAGDRNLFRDCISLTINPQYQRPNFDMRQFQWENGDWGSMWYYGSKEMYGGKRYVRLSHKDIGQSAEEDRKNTLVECRAGGVSWEGEGGIGSTEWTLEKLPFEDENPPLRLTLEFIPNDDEEPEGEFQYTVGYRDFCYVLAAGLTNIYQTYGLMGYLKTMYCDEDWVVPAALEPFLRIKAYALHREKELIPKPDSDDRFESHFRTQFATEMDILMADME